MSFRRSAEAVAARSAWRAFLDRHASEVAAAGLPPAATESTAAWDDLLMHGFLAADLGGFTVEHLTEPQYAALVRLTGAYFDEFGANFTPMALRRPDQDLLARRARPPAP